MGTAGPKVGASEQLANLHVIVMAKGDLAETRRV